MNKQFRDKFGRFAKRFDHRDEFGRFSRRGVYVSPIFRWQDFIPNYYEKYLMDIYGNMYDYMAKDLHKQIIKKSKEMKMDIFANKTVKVTVEPRVIISLFDKQEVSHV